MNSMLPDAVFPAAGMELLRGSPVAELFLVDDVTDGVEDEEATVPRAPIRGEVGQERKLPEPPLLRAEQEEIIKTKLSYKIELFKKKAILITELYMSFFLFPY